MSERDFAAQAVVVAVLASACATAPAPVPPRPQSAPNLDALVQLAPNHKDLLAGTALPAGLHRFEIASAAEFVGGNPGFLDWGGHPLLHVWADSSIRLHPVDETGVQGPVVSLDQSIPDLQTSLVPVPNAIPWIQHWNTEGPPHVGLIRLDGSESRPLLSLPATAGTLQDVILSTKHQGVAVVAPTTWESYRWVRAGPANLHLIGAASGTVIAEPKRGELEHWGDRWFVEGSRAVGHYAFRSADAELVETVLLFVDLETGEASEQTITDPRVEGWSYFDGAQLITDHAEALAARAGSPMLFAFRDPNPIETRVKQRTAVRCREDVWALTESTSAQTGIERVWLQSLTNAAKQRPLWEEQTRTPAQLVWQSSVARRTRPLACVGGQLLTWGILDPEYDLADAPTLLVMISDE